MNCVKCGISVIRLPKDVRSNVFCSHACAASYNSKGKHQKRYAKLRTCIACGAGYICQHATHRSTRYCPNCLVTYGNGRAALTAVKKSLTLAAFHGVPYLKDKHPSWMNANVRSLNRTWNKEMLRLPCSVESCGYSLHVELCHKRPITDFPESATLGEVNSPSNVVPLCPNHHWEFDNGHLILP